MKKVMANKQCPYPGLRPYNENESIYFKGRDLHVRQITKLLEERKVLMITGASGDGKSSLVYAGVIPNARAGFFKAQYNRWKFVDFKPERDPLTTLATSLSEQLSIDLAATKEKLSYGFSSLVEIYKSSDYYIDEASNDWINADNEERKRQRNNAANLFILADQFEEFFTNAENFNAGNPSINAYTAVNLLLETANIANQENLPIYIVFTMRSDFISQCVAFKGLPEMIGFSQFFVPRLKRNEIKQVIQEPAELSGGKVSNRLTELLINELRDGFDQLPVIQHALNQLWKLADNGNQELDLLHLAKLAGVSSKFLDGDDLIEYVSWFNKLPDYRKEYYKNPGLGNVLNTHANYLYESAYQYFNEKIYWAPKKIYKSDAQLILKVVFQSLTKIDDGRAVRNRMSLAEITQIINKEHISFDVVCGVLNVFRLPDSTFVRPFININDLDTQYIAANTILDITHEALIRNWELLKVWEQEELNNVEDFKEFQIQLNRWVSNNKTNEYLLTPGNLLHFEKWYKQCKPNPFWILKYDESKRSRDEKITEAELVNENIAFYLKKSRNHITQIEKAKKRRRNIALVSASFVILVLSVLMAFAFKEKKNAEQQKLIADEQKTEAQKQQEQAEQERNKAVYANWLAETNAKEALQAKEASDKARKNAEKMRLLAEAQRTLAKNETIKAQQQKQLAEKQRVRAELASDSAHALSMLATAQTLAFKAKQKSNNTEQNLSMALRAYQLNKNFGGYSRDAAVFEGLNAALSYNNYDNNVFSSSHYILNTKVELNGDLSFFTNNNQLTRISSKNSEVIDVGRLTKNMAIRKVFILPEYLIISTQNKELYLANRSNFETTKLTSVPDFVNNVQLINGILYCATKTNGIYTLNMDKGETNFSRKIEFSGELNEMISAKNSLYLGFKNGLIKKVNLKNNQTTLIDSIKGRVSALAISNNGYFLVAGSSVGEVKVLSVFPNVDLVQKINMQDLLINDLSLNQQNNLLAITSSNNIISIYDMENWQQKPVLIKSLTSRQEPKSIAFNSHQQLVVTYTDNSVKVWETDSDILAQKAQQLLMNIELNADVSDLSKTN